MNENVSWMKKFDESGNFILLDEQRREHYPVGP
jgi:hypothetical protein